MRFVKLQSKDVINVVDGWCGKCIQAIVVEKYSFFKLLCFFKEAPCIVIPIECVVSIGGDVILVSIEP